MTLTQQLQQRRRKLYMTQKGVAKLLGLTGAAVSLRERGDSETIKLLEAWAGALGCELRLITGGSSVICKNCREQVHSDCPGGNWCDCAHRATAVVPYQVGLIGHPGAGTSTVAQKVAEEEDLRQAKIRAGVKLINRIQSTEDMIDEDPKSGTLNDLRTSLIESLDLLYLEPGLKEHIQRRHALDELAQVSNEAGILE